MGRPRKDAWKDKYKSQIKYNKKAMKNYLICVNILTEQEVYNKLESVPNKSKYIKDLIKKDVNEQT